MGEVDRRRRAAGRGSLTTDDRQHRDCRAGDRRATGRRARYTDDEGHDVIGGYDVVEELELGGRCPGHADTVLAPVGDQRNHAILLVAGRRRCSPSLSRSFFARGPPGRSAALTEVARGGAERRPERPGRARGVRSSS